MHINKYLIVLCMVYLLLCPRISSKANEKFNPPRLPGATLLIGSADPFSLAVTTAHETWRILPEPTQPQTRDETPIYPSISRDAKLVAAARLKGGGYPYRVAISVYSIPDKKWTEYAEGQFSGAVALSADASKLAYSANRRRVGASGDEHLHVIDLKTGRESIGPKVESSSPVFATWSPDSRRLAYSSGWEIKVWDTDTGAVSKVADGDMPAWSPSGEWIAYLQGVPGRWQPKCLVVHPDGSDGKILVELPHKKNIQRFFVEAPVWSPDSATILLNELADVDKWTMDIHLLDLKTLKLKTIFKDELPVVGWAEAK